MSYKWKPSAAKKREFAERMSNPENKLLMRHANGAGLKQNRRQVNLVMDQPGAITSPPKPSIISAYPIGLQIPLLNRKMPEIQVLYGYSCQEKIHQIISISLTN